MQAKHRQGQSRVKASTHFVRFKASLQCNQPSSTDGRPNGLGVYIRGYGKTSYPETRARYHSKRYRFRRIILFPKSTQFTTCMEPLAAGILVLDATTRNPTTSRNGQTFPHKGQNNMARNAVTYVPPPCLFSGLGRFGFV